ncbi:MAG: GNAT family N-acetyltransferase [Solirubrobacteraceae bacterium]
MELGAGLRAVTLERGDAGAVTALVRACEAHDGGLAERTLEDMQVIFDRPSFSLADSAVGVREGDALVGYAAIPWSRDADAWVLPSHRGRGIGTALMRWTWEAARALGYPAVGQSVHERSAAAIALLGGNGYEQRWTSWILEIALTEPPAPPVVVPPYRLRDFVPGRDDRAAYRVIEDAFSEWPDRDPESFEDWAAQTLRRPGFVPEQLLLAVRDDDEDVVGALVLVDDDEPFVDQLAVAREHRGRGLARALLQRAFAIGWERGRRSCVLATDTRTGALGLYEHVGMTPRGTYLHLERRL